VKEVKQIKIHAAEPLVLANLKLILKNLKITLSIRYWSNVLN